jgi:hypothetical protein
VYARDDAVTASIKAQPFGWAWLADGFHAIGEYGTQLTLDAFEGAQRQLRAHRTTQTGLESEPHHGFSGFPTCAVVAHVGWATQREFSARRPAARFLAVHVIVIEAFHLFKITPQQFE